MTTHRSSDSGEAVTPERIEAIRAHYEAYKVEGSWHTNAYRDLFIALDQATARAEEAEKRAQWAEDERDTFKAWCHEHGIHEDVTYDDDIRDVLDETDDSDPGAVAAIVLEERKRADKAEADRYRLAGEKLRSLLAEYVKHSDCGAVEHAPDCDLADRARNAIEPPAAEGKS